MSTAQKDRSTIFNSIALQLGTKKAAVYDDSFHLHPNGVTFKTDASLHAWTEVDMKLQVPADKMRTRKEKRPATKRIDCRGIVVQCKKEPKSGVYDVALLFCGMNPRTQQKIREVSKQLSPSE